MSEDQRDGFRVVLSKEDFEFSAAHSTVFSADRAEPLHGHNYRVAVELRGSDLDPLGFLIDFDRFKSTIRALCLELDDNAPDSLGRHRHVARLIAAPQSCEREDRQ